MALKDYRHMEFIALMDGATNATSIEVVADELGVTPRTVSNALRTGKVNPRKLPLYIEKLDGLLGNGSIPSEIAKKLGELRLNWFGPQNQRILPLWVKDNAPILEDACSAAFINRTKHPERFVGYSLVLGIAYLYMGVLNAKNLEQNAGANAQALSHLQNAHEYGAKLLNTYLLDRLVMQISCAIFNPCEQSIVSDPQQRALLKKKLEQLGTVSVCHRIAGAVRRDYAPLWNGVLFAVTAEDYGSAATFYRGLERYCSKATDPATGDPLLKSMWNEYIVAHEREKLEAALRGDRPIAVQINGGEKSAKKGKKAKCTDLSVVNSRALS